MTTLAQRKKQPLVKGLLIGDSGAGKTGSLLPLIEAGYKFCIIDFDNGLDFLTNQVMATMPERAGNVHYVTCRDQLKLVGTKYVLKGSPKAWPKAMNMLTNWKEDEGSLGPVSELGPEWVTVIDSLSLAGIAAFRHVEAIQGFSDKRQTYQEAQGMVMGLISELTSEFHTTHVLVMTHMNLVELENGIHKGLPAAIGKAISSEIPKYFNLMLEAKASGQGDKVKRKLRTVPSLTADTKNPLPVGTLAPELPLESGLLTIFKALQWEST